MNERVRELASMGSRTRTERLILRNTAPAVSLRNAPSRKLEKGPRLQEQPEGSFLSRRRFVNNIVRRFCYPLKFSKACLFEDAAHTSFS